MDRRKLQVFVSSTYTDLIEERQTAVAAILKAGHIPAGMELFTSGDKSQLDVIKRWIEESDVYMLILGTRYGSIEPISGLSYTEVEYDYAVSIGKPFFALVMGDLAVDKKLKSKASSFLEKENPDKLKLFRAKTLSKMCSIYADIRDIKSHIYESLIDLSHQPDLEGWVRGSLASDPKPLYDQISNLKIINEQLEREIAELRLKSTEDNQNNGDNIKFEELMKLLKSTKIVIPAESSSSGEIINTDAFRLFVLNRNLYITGVNISGAVSIKARWFERNLYPTFVTHRILNREIRTTGSKLYSMSELGLDFCAWLDRRTITNESAS